MGTDRTLQSILVRRMLVVSLIASVALLTFFVLHYALYKPRLRELTLQYEAASIVDKLKRGEHDLVAPEFLRYPDHYAFRVFDRRSAERRRLVAQVNAQLMPKEDPYGLDDVVRAGFGPIDGPDDRSLRDRWLFTLHADLHQHSYWVQVAMIGDPAWRWQPVMMDEMRDHVLLPVLFIIPALASAMLLTTFAALRSLRDVAGRAERLGLAVSGGERFAALPSANLPREIKVVVAAINAMLGNLDRAARQQGQFASDAAHELRTPLAVLLLEASRLPECPGRETIIHDLRTLAAMVNQLLRLAQAEDIMSRDRHPVDVAAIARGVCRDLGGTAVAAGVTFSFDEPPEPVPLLGHETLVDIAIRNVLDNAVRFSPRGGIVAVAVDADATVTVEDNGPGIPDEHKDLIFDRLWRSRSGHQGGAGIGLALVRRIIRLHGGDAWVEDVPAGGAKFVLAFQPIYAAAHRPVTRQASPAGNPC